jgi:hypothetical protein
MNMTRIYVVRVAAVAPDDLVPADERWWFVGDLVRELTPEENGRRSFMWCGEYDVASKELGAFYFSRKQAEEAVKEIQPDFDDVTFEVVEFAEKEPGTCGICNTFGHPARDCPNRPPMATEPTI